MWKSMKMLGILYRAGSSKDELSDYDNFSDEFSKMQIPVEKGRETPSEFFDRVRKSQFPVASQFLPDYSPGNCWAVTAIELYTNFLSILRYNKYITKDDFKNALTSINHANKKIIAMTYREEQKKIQKIILEVQANEPRELLSVMLGDYVAIVTYKKKELTEKLEVYEKSEVLQNTTRYKELLEQLEYSIEVITPESYPNTENGNKYLDDNLLQSLMSDYGGNWLLMFDIIQKTTRSSHFYLDFYDFYYEFSSDHEQAETYILLMIDYVIGFAAMKKDHVVSVLNQNKIWKIVDSNYPDKPNFISDNLGSAFEELAKLGFNKFQVVCYKINNSIIHEKKQDSPRKRVRDERLSIEEILLREIEEVEQKES